MQSLSSADVFDPLAAGMQQDIVTTESGYSMVAQGYIFLCTLFDSFDDVGSSDGYAGITVDDIDNDSDYCPAMVWDTTGAAGSLGVTITNPDGAMGTPNIYYDATDNVFVLAASASDVPMENMMAVVTEADQVFFTLVPSNH